MTKKEGKLGDEAVARHDSPEKQQMTQSGTRDERPESSEQSYTETPTPVTRTRGRRPRTTA